MAHYLALSGQRGTLVLSSVGWVIKTFAPVTPSERTTDSVSLLDGGERPHSAYSNVTESVELYIEKQGNLQAVQTLVRDLQLYFVDARRYQARKVGEPVYIIWQPDGDSEQYRSELLGGKYEITKDVYHTWWVNLQQEIKITWTRRYYWEGDEVEVGLINGNEPSLGNPVTGGINVLNCNDGGGTTPNKRRNSVTIGTVVPILGDLPAPPIIHMYNTNTGDYNPVTLTGTTTAQSKDYLIYHNVDSDPVNYAPQFEAEAAPTGLHVASYGASSGTSLESGSLARVSRAFTNSWLGIFEWPLTQSFLISARGNWFDLVANVTSVTSTQILVQARIYSGLTKLWEGLPVNITAGGLNELGAVQLPPGITELSRITGQMSPLTLTLYAYSMDGVSRTISLDVLYAFPLDGKIKLNGPGVGVAQNEQVIYNGVTGQAYSEAAGTGYQGSRGNFGARGSIRLVPGKSQKLWFLHTYLLGQAVYASRVHSVRVYYRPRYLVL